MCALDYDLISKVYDSIYMAEQLRKYSISFSYIGKVQGLVLDAGCGTGLLYSFLKKFYNFEYVGLDSSLGMLLETRRKIDSNAHLVMGCIEYMPFRSNIFSLACCFTVLHETSLTSSLKELSRTLLPGHILIVSILKKVNTMRIELLKEYKKHCLELVRILDCNDLKDVIYVFRCQNG